MKIIKHIITISLIAFICSCNSKTKESKAIIKDTIKTVKKVKKTDDFRAHLKATEPATEAQFKNWLPTQLGKLKRIEFTKTRISQNNIASAGAIYTNGDNKKLELKIVDGASKDGLLAIQTHVMAQNLKLNTTKASGYEKTYEKNNLKVMETYVKKDSFYRVSFLYDMRYDITIESHGISHDKLWQAISKLNLKALEDF